MRTRVSLCPSFLGFFFTNNSTRYIPSPWSLWSRLGINMRAGQQGSLSPPSLSLLCTTPTFIYPLHFFSMAFNPPDPCPPASASCQMQPVDRFIHYIPRTPEDIGRPDVPHGTLRRVQPNLDPHPASDYWLCNSAWIGMFRSPSFLLKFIWAHLSRRGSWSSAILPHQWGDQGQSSSLSGMYTSIVAAESAAGGMYPFHSLSSIYHRHS